MKSGVSGSNLSSSRVTQNLQIMDHEEWFPQFMLYRKEYQIIIHHENTPVQPSVKRILSGMFLSDIKAQLQIGSIIIRQMIIKILHKASKQIIRMQQEIKLLLLLKCTFKYCCCLNKSLHPFEKHCAKKNILGLDAL